MERLGLRGVAVNRIRQRGAAEAMQTIRGEIERRKEKIWLGRNATFDPRKIVYKFNRLTEPAVEDRGYFVSNRVDGIDARCAVGDGLVACDSEVHFSFKVVAAIRVDIAEARNIRSRDGIGSKVENGDIGWGGGHFACEPDLISVVVPGPSFVSEVGGSHFDELNFWRLSAQDVVETLVESIISRILSRFEQRIDGGIDSRRVDIVCAKIAVYRLWALERSWQEICILGWDEYTGRICTPCCIQICADGEKD